MRTPGSVLLLFLVLFGAGCGGGSSTRVVRLAHGLDPSHSVHQGMVYMAEQVWALSGGTMRIDLYPSQQLGTERECLELLQIGSLGMTKVSASVMENFAPAFAVMSLPYLFRDEAHRFAVLEGEIGKQLLLETQQFRLRGLTYYDAGSRSFYTVDRPVHAPADLNGLKIRTQESATSMRMVNEMGGSATPISWGELYTALQQGVVDGAENNPPSFYLSRHYEVARYYTLDEHTAPPDVLVISTVVWNDLTPQEQAWLQEAADASAQHQKQLWREASDAALRAVEADGVEIIRPDKTAFGRQVADLYSAYQQDQPQIYALIEQIREVE